MIAGGERHKVTLMGPSAAGKTSILHRFASGSFSEDQAPTIGAAFTSKELDTTKGKVILNIWDTAGQERFKSLVPKYARGSSAVVVVFDVTSPDSFESAQSLIEKERGEYEGKMAWFLVANKNDCEPFVDLERVREWAQATKMRFFSTSAKTGDGIGELFASVAEDVAGTLDESEAVEVVDVEEPGRDAGDGGGCC